MPIKVHCPSCERPLQIGEKFLGRQVRCPLCGHRFTAAPRARTSPRAPGASLGEDAGYELIEDTPAHDSPPAAEAGAAPRDAYSPELPRRRSPSTLPARSEHREEPPETSEDVDWEEADRLERRRWRAEETVSAPAIALMVAGGFVFLTGLFYAGMAVLMMAAPGRARRGSDAVDLFGSLAAACCVSVFGVGAGPVVFAGGWQMKRLRMYTFAFVATIVAIVPLTPCWILALPFGIWALIVLQKPHVKSAFQ